MMPVVGAARRNFGMEDKETKPPLKPWSFCGRAEAALHQSIRGESGEMS